MEILYQFYILKLINIIIFVTVFWVKEINLKLNKNNFKILKKKKKKKFKKIIISKKIKDLKLNFQQTPIKEKCGYLT
jgi:hypothetical protein